MTTGLVKKVAAIVSFFNSFPPESQGFAEYQLHDNCIILIDGLGYEPVGDGILPETHV